MSAHWDVIVIGGGHAGCEAAHAAWRTGARTLLLTHKPETIGEMSCNPAMGGLGKGHLIREVDAMDGLMGRVSDQASIQYRLLNRSKGPAVRGPRAQIDRGLYRAAMQQALAESDGLTIESASVEDLVIENGRVAGVTDDRGRTWRAGAVILTTGTFLKGVIHRGDERIPAGRIGDQPSIGLSERLYGLGLRMGRLKTGTPARLEAASIAWAELEMQEADAVPSPFSFMANGAVLDQIACGVTHTNDETHRIITENLGESAVYGGHLSGKGPRYCPSIEDKVVRFADKASHQVFLEPEGLPGNPDGQTVYPNGVSTSVSEATQLAFLQTMQGLKDVRVRRYGYAIEYDYVDPTSLHPTLELRALPGLYLAGQINGTTGYEEAGAQGLIAGLNAARATTGQDGIVLGRDEAYIGVMIDDLVTRGVTEPYRMFTSRAEFRLTLRADNADQRLTPLAIDLGIVGPERCQAFDSKIQVLHRARSLMDSTRLTPNEANRLGLNVNQDGQRRSLGQLLAYPGASLELFTQAWPEIGAWPEAVAEQIQIDAAYAGYLDRQAADAEALRRDEALVIPADLDFSAVGGLSNEVREKLSAVRPRTLGQAGRIEGVTPGALTALLAHVRRARQEAAA